MTKKVKTVDLFAGIGGLRMPFDRLGAKCVFTSEMDKYARQTYEANFKNKKSHVFDFDISARDENSIPDHDILLAGFPCQPFSIAGVSSNNHLGRESGFADRTRGTLFFDVARVLGAKRPKMFLLENVKNLVSHDGGKTFETIMLVLDNLGYEVSWEVINASAWVPQNRRRVFLVGVERQWSGSVFDFSAVSRPSPDSAPVVSDILHSEGEPEEPPYTIGDVAEVNEKYTLRDGTWESLKSHKAKHRSQGNGFGYALVGPNDVAKTMSARYYKDGAEILVSKPSGNPRRLTPRECARLMGFPDSFQIPVSDTQAYKQFGNSVAVPVVQAIADAMIGFYSEAER